MTDLEGKWACVSWISNGVSVKDSVRNSLELELSDGRYSLRRANRLIAELAYSVDETKEPYELRLKSLDGAKNHTFIFELEAGFLVTCGYLMSFDSPCAFESEPGLDMDLKTWQKIMFE